MATADTNVAFHDALGDIRYALGLFVEAERSFADCVELAPNGFLARLKWGEALDRLGERDEAKSLVFRAEDLKDPNHALTPEQRLKAEQLPEPWSAPQGRC